MVSLVPRDARVDRTDAVKKECVEELSMTDPRHWCRSKQGIDGECHEERPIRIAVWMSAFARARKLVVGLVSLILANGLMFVLLLIRRLLQLNM